MAGGRRRTDTPPAASSGPPGPGLSDHPTAPGRRGDRPEDGQPYRNLTRGGGRDDLLAAPAPGHRTGPQGRPSRPPVPARVRPPVPPLRPVPVAPQTTMAPFQPSPAPADDDAPSAGDALWSSSRAAGARPSRGRGAGPAEAFEPPSRRAGDAPSGWAAADRPSAPPTPSPAPSLAWDLDRPPVADPEPAERDLPDADRSSPWSTGPTIGRPAPAVPPAAPALGAASGPAYGDWTRPSRSGAADDPVAGRFAPADDDYEPDDDYEAVDESRPFARLRASAAMQTTAIPEREVRRERRVDDAPTGPDLDAVTHTGTIGGRAASRAERRSADEARRRAEKERASAAGDGGRRSPRRAAVGLAAVAVVALGVLGVYSYASPHAQEASAQHAPVATSAPAGVPDPGTATLPTLSAGPLTAVPSSAAPTSVAPIRVPVTVLNATTTNGLAAKVSGIVKAGGWPTAPVGTYEKKDIAASTVYFTQGDENQRQAALQLVTQFPQLQGPVPRFFDIPGNPTPGLVVVIAGDWKS